MLYASKMLIFLSDYPKIPRCTARAMISRVRLEFRMCGSIFKLAEKVISPYNERMVRE